MTEQSQESKPDSGAIYEQLRREILSCKIAPGEQIFEQELGRRFGVSKSPVREALLRLREQNLVEVRPRSGYRVKPFSLAEVMEMYEIRFIYEQGCIELAVQHGNEETMAGLMRAATPGKVSTVLEWVEANRQFHTALANACGNMRFSKVSSDFIAQFDRFTLAGASRLTGPRRFERDIKEHQAMVVAIQHRNLRRAVTLIRRHIGESRQRTLTALNTPILVP